MVVKPGKHKHSLTLWLPTGEYEFRGQLRHADGPGTDLYVELGHKKHCVPLFPVNAGGQWHMRCAQLPTSDTACEGQGVQAAAGPNDDLNVFAGHGRQAVPFVAAKVPGLHVHCMIEEDAARLQVLPGHGPEQSALVRLPTAPYLPAAHGPAH